VPGMVQKGGRMSSVLISERNINIRLIKSELNEGCKGFCSMDTNHDFIILINKTMTEDEQTLAFLHEMLHVWHNDFRKKQDVNELEKIRHEELKGLLSLA
jgi:Zn-dependent peptidase ImmA (M78 family)